MGVRRTSHQAAQSAVLDDLMAWANNWHGHCNARARVHYLRALPDGRPTLFNSHNYSLTNSANVDCNSRLAGYYRATRTRGKSQMNMFQLACYNERQQKFTAREIERLRDIRQVINYLEQCMTSEGKATLAAFHRLMA